MMGARCAFALAWVLFGLGAVWNAGTEAAVPQRDRVEGAIAKSNASAGRGHAMQIDLIVQIGDRPAVARGQLLTDPSGQARLELRGAGDLVERHLLRDGESQAARNGQPLVQARPFLPPVFVLQASSADRLRHALESFKVDPEPMGLIECGDEDCLLLGDPEQAIAPVAGPALAGLEAYEFEKVQAEEARRIDYEAVRVWFWAGADQWVLWALDQEAEALRQEALAEAEAAAELREEEPEEEPRVLAGWNGEIQSEAPSPSAEVGPLAAPGATEPSFTEVDPAEDPLLPPPLFAPEPEPLPAASLWVSRDNYEIRGLETAAGTRVELGPPASFGGVLLPAWIQIEEPGQEPIRLEIEAARRVELEPEAFSEAWLTTAEITPGAPTENPATDL